jgi:hypothetical protein
VVSIASCAGARGGKMTGVLWVAPSENQSVSFKYLGNYRKFKGKKPINHYKMKMFILMIMVSFFELNDSRCLK